MENRLGRLQRNSEFLRLRYQGTKLRPQPWLIFNFQKNELGHLRLGITAGRKVASAVLRNKLKRWSREYARQFIKENFNPSYDLSVVFLPGKEGFYQKLEHSELDRHMAKVFSQFRQ